MKKFLMIGALALGLVAASEQQASAWIKCNFSVGLNWTWESGNNSILWGAFSNGQVPGYPTDYSHTGFTTVPNPYAMMGGGGPVPYGDHGYAPPAPHGAPGFVAPPPAQTAEPPAAKSSYVRPTQPTSTSYYGSNGYQPVGYSQTPSYYQAPSYSPPSYGYYGGQGYYGSGSYGNSQVPSYWYGY